MDKLNVSRRALTVLLLTAFPLAVLAANVRLGNYAMNNEDRGSYNVAVGDYALYSNTTGYNNIASGYQSLFSNTTGYRNIASGSYALWNNTSGSNNIASGYVALYSNTTGYGNSASGSYALVSNTTGNNNIASGYQSLYSNTTGSFNSASGSYALLSNTTGHYNVALGYRAGYNALGSSNVFIGNEAGYNETGSNKLYIDNTNTATPLIKGDFGTDALTVNGTLAVTGNITAPAIYHTDGTKMLSKHNGSVHLGPTSMVFTDSTVSATNADIMSSSVGRIQLGASATDTTTVFGTLNVPNPTSFFNAAHKGYVDALRHDMRNYDDRSVALSSALTALPTQGGFSSKACGIGSGIRGGYAAMALGCAAELSSFDLPATLPRFIRNASVNAGTSFLAHDDPDYTFKVGIAFNFGAPNSNRQASIRDINLRHRLGLVEHKNQKLMKKTAVAVNTLERKNQKLMKTTVAAVSAIERSNRRLQAQIKNLQSDKEEMLALRVDREEMLALRADNEILKTQIAQINELLMGGANVASR